MKQPIDNIAEAIILHSNSIEDVQCLVDQTCHEIEGLEDAMILHIKIVRLTGYQLNGTRFLPTRLHA